MSVKLEDVGLERYDVITKIANLSPIYVVETEKISDVVEKILSTNSRRISIVNKKMKLVGIVTTMDILNSFLQKINFNSKISSIMIRNVIFSNMFDTIELSLQKMKISRRGGLPIVGNKKVVGVINEKDFVRRFSKIKFNQKTEEVMTKKPFSIKPEFSILDTLKSMINTHYRRLPIIENNEPVGLVTAYDLLFYLRENNFSHLQEFLKKPVDEISRKFIFSISKDSDVSETIKLMKEKDVGGILVVDGKKLEGIITERNIIEQIY